MWTIDYGTGEWVQVVEITVGPMLVWDSWRCYWYGESRPIVEPF